MSNYLPFLLLLSIFACSPLSEPSNSEKQDDKAIINRQLDQWHLDAASANFKAYFSLFSEQGKYIGTDASEIWSVEAFQSFAQPYFDKGETWSFEATNRTVELAQSGNVAWFYELLDTWMGTCRGSGVFQKRKGEWKLEQYVLSLTVPNEKMDNVIATIKS